MADIASKIWDFVRDAWPSWKAAFVASMLAIAVGVAVVTKVELTGVTLQQWLVIGALGAAPWGLWFAGARVRRHRKRSIGFGIAITVEDPNQAKRLRADFIATLEAKLKTHHTAYPCHVIVHHPHTARRVTDLETARRVMIVSKAHFFIHGTARERTINGQPQHVLDLHGLVRHTAVEELISKKLSHEFREVFPQRVMLAQENDLFSFEFTAAWAEVGARYIVAIAALISNDLPYAEELLKGLERELIAARSPLLPSIAKIHNRLPARLADIYRAQLNRRAAAYIRTQDRELLVDAEPVLANLLHYAPNDYSALLFQAICEFVLRRDIAAAQAALDRCQGIPDPTWRYSRAFLHAYSSDLDAAYREYMRALEQPATDPSVPLQSEQFIHGVLAEEPGKGQLYYNLGLINYRVKQDYAAARTDFKQFLAQSDPKRYQRQHEVVKQWISRIDQRLSRLPSVEEDFGDDPIQLEPSREV